MSPGATPTTTLRYNTATRHLRHPVQLRRQPDQLQRQPRPAKPVHRPAVYRPRAAAGGEHGRQPLLRLEGRERLHPAAGRARHLRGAGDRRHLRRADLPPERVQPHQLAGVAPVPGGQPRGLRSVVQVGGDRVEQALLRLVAVAGLLHLAGLAGVRRRRGHRQHAAGLLEPELDRRVRTRPERFDQRLRADGDQLDARGEAVDDLPRAARLQPRHALLLRIGTARTAG